MLAGVLLNHGPALRARAATVEEIRAAVAWGINEPDRLCDYRTGLVLHARGRAAPGRHQAPPRELFPGKLMEACSTSPSRHPGRHHPLAPVPSSRPSRTQEGRARL